MVVVVGGGRGGGLKGVVWGAVDQLGLRDMCCSDLPWFMMLGTLRSDKGDVQETIAEK